MKENQEKETKEKRNKPDGKDYVNKYGRRK